MKKINRLNYKQFQYKDLNINFSKSRCRTMHITVKADGSIFYVVPYYVSIDEAMRFLSTKYDWLKKSITKIKEKTDINSAILSNNKRLTIEEKNTLLTKIDNYVKKYETLLNVKVNKYSLRNMTTLWGSCSTKTRNIRFNEKLYYKNDDFIEYIVLHELTHILVNNHSKKFYDIIKKYMPNYREITKS